MHDTRNEPTKLEIKSKHQPAQKEGIWMHLPLSILGSKEPEPILRKKLLLLKKFEFANPEKVIEILRKKQTKTPLDNSEQSSLINLWEKCDLDDLDYTELFVSHLPKIIDTQSPEFIMALAPQPILKKNLSQSDYLDVIKKSVLVNSNNVSRFALPRVRAKLAAKEIVCLITSDPEKIAELIKISPRYLACSVVTNLIGKCRQGRVSSKPEIRNQSKLILDIFNRAITGVKRRYPRRYGYWQIDYYFTEVIECVKIINSMEDKESRNDYITSMLKVWPIPDAFPKLLVNGVKNPAEITLEMMIELGMITDPSTYRNVIQPHIKKHKEKYPAIRACDFLVERLLDLPTKDPDRFASIDIWEQLESFKFDLTEAELSKCHHSISYPDTYIRV